MMALGTFWTRKMPAQAASAPAISGEGEAAHRRRVSTGLRRVGLPALLALSLTGCGGWWGGDEAPPLPGDRISVLELDEAIEVDAAAAEAPFTLPPAEPVTDWPTIAGAANHVAPHPSLGSGLTRVWRTSIGSGASSNRRIVNPPILAGGRLFAMDSVGRVSAIDAASGNRVWQVRVASPYEDSDPLGGGLAFADGVLVATTGFGEVLAIDPANGGAFWSVLTDSPIRAAPTVHDGQVYAVTVDSTIYAFDLATGEELWTHSGIVEGVGLLGGAAPAAGNGLVIAAFSSGEVFALRDSNGRPAWSDSLTAVRRLGPLASLADIRGAPIVDDQLVVATSHSGRLAAIDLRSGVRIWEQPVGGIETPTVAGNNIFTLTNNAELVALVRDRGLIRWVTPLPRFEDPEDRERPIVWAGPLLAGDRLWLASSTRRLVAIDPRTGELVADIDIGTAVTLPPIAAGNTLYLLSDGGDLLAYR